MALSRERIADELLKLLGLDDPSATVGIMLERNILRPVLPEIEPRRLHDLKILIAAEQAAEIPPQALRRFASLLPRDPALAETIAARLKLSNKARKRLACAVSAELEAEPEALAYHVGTECAVDRLLLAGNHDAASAIAAWKPPRLPIRGGVLMARGLPEGPIIARTLKRIERQWVEAGFPQGQEFEQIVDDSLAQALDG
jgi:poly(A) polymerase